jgi:endoglucanase
LSDKTDKNPNDTIIIDCGFQSKEEALKCVSLGDFIAFDVTFRKLLGTRVTGKSLDDRAGVATILAVLDFLKDKHSKIIPIVIFSDMEEVGERGAKIASQNIPADFAIAVDVSFALTNGEKKEKGGVMGNGTMIGISPIISRFLYEDFCKIAENKGTKYQIEVMNGLTSTNADQYQGMGIPSITLSIPLKYMHSPAEIVDLEDVSATAELIAEYINGTF